MKSSIILSCCMIALMGCSQKPKLGSGIHPENFDNQVKPADDFYEYACGGWIKNHPLTPEFSRFGTFDQLRENNQIQLKTLIEEISTQTHKKGSIEDKIGTFYRLGMDSVKTNSEGFSPILSELEAIGTLTTSSDVKGYLAKMHKEGNTPFFNLFSEADAKNSSMTIAWLYQNGIGMGERDYYLEKDDHTLNIQEQYHALMVKMFTRSKATDLIKIKMNPEQSAEAIFKLETQMAHSFMDRLELRNPDATYNKMSVKDLQSKIKDFDFDAYFTAMGLPNLDSVNIGQPAYLSSVIHLINNTPVDVLKAYLAWNIINDAASFLDDETKADNFAFYGKALSGKEEMQARWKQVVNSVNGCLSEAVGQMYVAKYFPPEAKERMINLVNNLQIALGERIDQLEWMSADTKKNAHEKLGTFLVKIGYPDKWRDYSGLDIANDHYYNNIKRAQQFEVAYQLAKVNKPTDATEWYMPPQMVNAYYNPTTNEICFPAGILQPPFFDLHADDAVNYGAIGVVIGHEMTHGFDDQGRQYDKNGNLNNWWMETDAQNFDQRTQVLVDYFNAIEVAPGIFANGKFTLGENIADNGGLQVSWQALQKAIQNKKVAENLDGYTADQRFFIAYAMLWAGNIREKEILRLTKEDSHSLGRLRVNATLKHIPQFIKAFDIKEGDKMYLAPEKRASIW